MKDRQFSFWSFSLGLIIGALCGILFNALALLIGKDEFGREVIGGLISFALTSAAWIFTPAIRGFVNGLVEKPKPHNFNLDTGQAKVAAQAEDPTSLQQAAKQFTTYANSLTTRNPNPVSTGSTGPVGP